MLLERNIDVLCVSETWLLPHTSDTLVNIPNYTIHRCDKGRGAGVCIYAKKCLNPTIVNTDVTTHSDVEDVFIKVQCRKLPSVIIGCMYRHPKALIESFDYITDIFRNICLLKKKIFILGDMNDNLLSKNNKLSQIIRNNKLTQLIDTPTRTTPTSTTLLDVIITNCPDQVIHTDVVPSVVADHDLITVTTNISKPKRLPITKTVRDLQHYNSDILCSHILNHTNELNKILQTDNVNEQVDVLTSVLSGSVNSCAPRVTKVIRRPPAPWIDSNIREAMEATNKAQRILKQNRSNIELQCQYKNLKRQVKNLINHRKKQFYLEELKKCKGDTRLTWKVIKDIVPSVNQTTTTHTPNDIVNKAQVFNEFFGNVGKNTYEETQALLGSENIAASVPNAVSANMTPFRPQPVDTNTVVLTIKQLQKNTVFRL